MIPGIIAQQAGVAESGDGPVFVTEDAYFLNVCFQIDATGVGDGTGYVADQSRHAHALTYGGSASVADEFFEFNGTTDYLQTNHRTLWIPGSRMTWEFFGVQFDAGSGTNVLASHYEGSGGHDWAIQYNWTTGVLQLTAYTSANDGTPDILDIAWAPSTSAEYDIGIMWDGADLRCYIDGTYQGKVAFAGPWGVSMVDQELIIGADDGPSGGVRNFFDGRMRAFRMTRGYDRAAGSEVSYTRHALPLCTAQSATTDPNWDKVVLLLGGGNDGVTIRDESAYDWPLRKFGNVAVDTVNVAIAGVNAITFDGSGDYISVPHDPLLALATKDYTIELFARHTQIGTGTNNDKTYIAKYAASSNQREWAFWYGTNSSPDTLRTFSGNASPVNLLTNFTATLNTYYHVSSTRSGNDKRHFVDGVQNGATLTNTNDFTPLGNRDLGIGQLGSGDLNFFWGQMSELRLTIGSCRYTAGFSPPTAAFPRG